MNNVNLAALGKFIEDARRDPVVARVSKVVEGEWNFEEGEPQFRATLVHPVGESLLEADFAPPLGGRGLAPDPIQYCLYGTASCFGGTFVTVAAAEGVPLRKLRVRVENQLDLRRTLGLSQDPPVRKIILTLSVQSDAPREKLLQVERLAAERCPGVYCLTHAIALETRLEMPAG